jgi:gamma-glutamylcyclotransferase (GGCT)/AIG2-like uncharacterized protein YtfP
MAEPSCNTTLVFVYGTLRRGGSNDINALHPPPDWVGRAEVRGCLFDLGAYPGVILGGDRPVQGEVYAVSAALLVVLDEIEEVFPQQTGEYQRREVDVVVAGVARRCVVYEVAADRVVGRPVIASGDWFARG